MLEPVVLASCRQNLFFRYTIFCVHRVNYCENSFKRNLVPTRSDYWLRQIIRVS